MASPWDDDARPSSESPWDPWLQAYLDGRLKLPSRATGAPYSSASFSAPENGHPDSDSENPWDPLLQAYLDGRLQLGPTPTTADLYPSDPFSAAAANSDFSSPSHVGGGTPNSSDYGSSSGDASIPQLSAAGPPYSSSDSSQATAGPIDFDPGFLDSSPWQDDGSAGWMLVGNPANRRLKRQYVREKGPWPKVPETGQDYHVAHLKATADGGTDTLDNIKPMHPDEHIAEHMANGDFARWARRAGIARAFGGTVARSFSGLSLLPDITGILSGRIRTNSFDNFTSDMMGIPSQEDIMRQNEDLRKRMFPNSKPGDLVT